MHALTPNGGLDWAAIALSWAAIHQLGRRRRNGFAFFILANACWIAFGATVGNPALLIGNAGFLVNNVLGYLRWAPPSAGNPAQSGAWNPRKLRLWPGASVAFKAESQVPPNSVHDDFKLS